MPTISDGPSPIFNVLSAGSSLTTKAILTIGLLWATKAAFGVLSFLYLYFVRSGTLNKYIRSSSRANDATWALVTGASDGIGKGFAEELCSRGINVVLHGRNERKLEDVRDSILRRWPARQLRLLVLEADAGARNEAKLNEASKSLEDLKGLRILINNIAGYGSATPLWAPLTDRSCSDVGQILDITARFPTEITRVLLPQLIRNKPSLIINVGSGISDFACPYLEIYTGAKAYNKAWSKCLGLELKAEKHDVEVLHLQVGMVSSNTARRDPTFLIPSSRKFAKCGLDVVGCGSEVVWPYWPHALQFGSMAALPESLRNRLLLNIGLKEKALTNTDHKTE